MEKIRESSLDEYASQFWYRELHKGYRGFRSERTGKTNHDAFEAIFWGESPLRWLENVHDYKLPNCWRNCKVDIVRFERVDITNIVINPGLLRSGWFEREAHIIPIPTSNKLSDLAKTFSDRGYFDNDYDHTQIKCWRRWKSRGSLEGAITEYNMPLIELNDKGEHQIVDGWGRLLPYEALVQEGFRYVPVPVFLATLGPVVSNSTV